MQNCRLCERHAVSVKVEFIIVNCYVRSKWTHACFCLLSSTYHIFLIPLFSIGVLVRSDNRGLLLNPNPKCEGNPKVSERISRFPRVPTYTFVSHFLFSFVKVLNCEARGRTRNRSREEPTVVCGAVALWTEKK